MPAVFRVTTKGKLFGQDIQNVMHFAKEVPNEASKLELAQFVVDRVLSQWRFGAVEAHTWHQVMVQRPSDENDTPVLLPTAVTGALSNSTQVFAPMCAVLQIKTGVGGRTGRGRIYLSGMGQADLVQGQWGINAINRYQSIANSMMQWFGGFASQSGWAIGVSPRNPEGEEFKEATQIVLRPYPGTQVRRNFFRGK